jgi:SNF family Na+-dependent transporter
MAHETREEVSHTGYLLGLLGYAIGIGNLWRFPYLVGKWGGGAFVVAYLICLFLVAIPAYLIEMVMGQYTRKSTIHCFRMIHPRWAGVGYSQAVMLFFCLGYYNVLLAYAVIYIAGSLFDPLPWAANSARYWKEDVLNSFGGDYEGAGFGGIQWNIALALLVVWVIIFFSVAFGKRILAKVTWVTVLGPIIMLIVLLIRTVTLDGAVDGIQFYICKFDGAMLGNLDMWGSACGQILFSLSPGMGTAITLSSFTKPKEDVVKTCMIVSLCNSAFSLVGGIAIFAVVGNITYNINAAGGMTTVTEQAKSGPGLAFIAIAEGMKTFGNGTNSMSVIFFMVLLTLGLDSTFAWAETFLCYVDDVLKLVGIHLPRWKTVGLTCAGFFLCGLPYCTRMGDELLDTMDHYVTSYYLLLGVAVEAVMFMYSFGWRRSAIAVKRATFGNAGTPNGRELRPDVFWKFCLVCAVPAMCLFLFVYAFVADTRNAYGGYPVWVQVVGWSSLLLTLIMTPLGALLNWNGKCSLPAMEKEEASLAELVQHHGGECRSPMAQAVGNAVVEPAQPTLESARDTVVSV